MSTAKWQNIAGSKNFFTQTIVMTVSLEITIIDFWLDQIRLMYKFWATVFGCEKLMAFAFRFSKAGKMIIG